MIKGVYTALITPFLDDYTLDEDGLRDNIRLQIAAGIDGLVVLGTTAETSTLTSAEQKRVLSIAVEEGKDKIPLWVGTGSASTEETIQKTQLAKDMGADGALIVTPYYNRPTQEGLYCHFQKVASSCEFPIMLYNIPGRTGVNMLPKTVKLLSELPGIVAIKEATGSLPQMMDIIQTCKTEFSLLSGDDALTLPVIACGGTGVVSVLSNLLPTEILSLTHAALKGDYDFAKERHYRLLSLIKAAFIESNPSPIKAMMEMAGLKAGPVRLPLTPLTSTNHQEISTCLNEILTLQN